MTSQISVLQSVVERLDKLEKQNRTLKRVGMLVLVLFCLVFVMGQALPGRRIIEAEGFILRDANGKMRAALGISEGAPHLSLLDEEGTARIFLTLAANKPAVWLFDAKVNPRVSLATDAGGDGLLSLLDGMRKQRAVLGLLPDGSPKLELTAEGERSAVTLGAMSSSKGSSSGLVLLDANRKPRGALLLDDQDVPMMVLYDNNGQARAKMNSTRDGPTLGFIDANGTIRAALGALGIGPALLFHDANGRAIFKAP